MATEDREFSSEGGQGKENNPGNFANDPEKASRAGQTGGKSTHSGGQGTEVEEGMESEEDM
jgi:general stress protein YciG